MFPMVFEDELSC